MIKRLLRAKSQEGPTIIEVKTTIGFGSPNKAGTNGVHGAPLGEVERNSSEVSGLILKNVLMFQKRYTKFSKIVLFKRANEDKYNGIHYSKNMQKHILN